MSDVIKLAESLKKLDDKIVKCMRCGTCQSVCPVFAESFAEGDVARGKLALLSNLSQKILSDASGVRERLERCLLCGSCQAACPSGVSILDIFMEARALCAAYMGLNPIKRLVFRGLLCNPKLLSFAMRFLPLSKLVMFPDHNAANTVCSPLLRFAMGGRHLPAMPTKTFSAKYGDVKIPAGKSGIKVLFFTGCMGDKVYVSTSEACLKIFKHHGVGVEIPLGMSCCGIPALASGDVVGFRTMMLQNLELLKNVECDYVITACASCTETIKCFWPKYAKGTPLESVAEKLGAKAMDISEFLSKVLKVGDVANLGAQKNAGETREKITYHDSCHLKKALGISKEPRQVLKLNPNYEFVEMKDSDRCCGCGGSFTITHYDLSKKIGEKKRVNIVDSGAKVVAAGCPACMMQISNALAIGGGDVRVCHVAEIYAESLKDD